MAAGHLQAVGGFVHGESCFGVLTQGPRCGVGWGNLSPRTSCLRPAAKVGVVSDWPVLRVVSAGRPQRNVRAPSGRLARADIPNLSVVVPLHAEPLVSFPGGIGGVAGWVKKKRKKSCEEVSFFTPF